MARGTRRAAGDQLSGKKRCEQNSGPVAGTAIIQGVTGGRKSLQYANVDGLAIFEGDIVLGTVEEVEAALDAHASDGGGPDLGPVLRSVGIVAGTSRQNRWPNGILPYEIDAGLPNQARVTDAIAHWEAHTRIRFVRRTAANAAQYPNFARFVNGSGCSSSVGCRRVGAQNITLGPGCSTGNAIHEIGHTLGLWHEQSREDRDSFVRIQWANIDPAMQHNFDQHITDGDDLGAYDYGSIMHYPANAFSTNGQPTIVALQALPPGVVMGQRTALSAGDIAGIHAMYPVGPTIKETHKDPIVDSHHTTKELVKDPISDPHHTIKEISKDPILDPHPTIKEAAWDPNPPGGTLVEHLGPNIPALGGGQFSGAVPFVMAGVGNTNGAASQLQAFGQALSAVQAQVQQLAAAYDAVAASLSGNRS